MSSDEVFLSAGGTFADLVARIDPAAYDQPGLGAWDVRSLVGHTARAAVTVADYLARPADTEDLRSAVDYYLAVTRLEVDHRAVAERGREAGASLGDDPSAVVRSHLDRAEKAIRATPPDTLVTCIVGGIKVSSYLPTRTFELVVHGLDIARATGLSVEFPQRCLEESLGLAAGVAAATGSGPEVLWALTGRAPLPAGFTVIG